MSRARVGNVALAFVAGVACEVHGLAAFALASALGVLCVEWLRVRAAFWSSAAALGVLVAAVHGHPADYIVKAHAAVVAGVVAGAVEQQPFGASFALRLDDGHTVLAQVSGIAPPAGTHVVVRGRFEPFDAARNPGEPSPRELARDRGEDARLVRGHILRTAPPDPFDWRTWPARIRAWAGSELRTRLAPTSSEILAGAMWGEKGALPSDLRAEFQDTGTTHVLVTAGLHLGVVATLGAWLLGALRCGRVSGSLATIVLVWIYAILSGAHLPAVRAATMVSFGLLARACGRQPFSWNALGLAAILVTALWPWTVDSVSFALSFSCVGAIMLCAKPLTEFLERRGIPHVACEALALTLATQIGTWPLTAAAFLVFAPYAPLANALVVPCIGVAMLLGFAMLAASPVPLVAQALANLEDTLLAWIVGVVRTVASLPGAHVIMTPPPLWTIVAYDGALVACIALWQSGRRGVACALIAAAVALTLWPPRPTVRGLLVTAIDVGQADSLLIQTPRGHAYLVDAGGRLERQADAGGPSPAEAIGERVVVPYLIRHGIHRLDGILISHPHGDHVGGAAPVLRAVGAGLFADSGQQYAGHAYRDALSAAHELHVPLLYPRGSDVWHTDDDVTLRFYGPTLPLLTNTRNDINNNSLVFRLEYGNFRMLFTGDAGAEAEQRILASGADVQADVLKVGHHGSAYSSTPDFIRAVSPRYAIISVGRDNLFGHPAPDTLATLQGAGVRSYRTDKDGAVTVETDGDTADVREFLSEEP